MRPFRALGQLGTTIAFGAPVHSPIRRTSRGQESKSNRIYFSRTLSRDRDHWDFGRVATAGNSSGARSSAALAVPKQYEATRAGGIEFREREENFALQ